MDTRWTEDARHAAGTSLQEVKERTGDTDDVRDVSPGVGPHVEVPVGRGVGVVETREAGHRQDQLVLHFMSRPCWREEENNHLFPFPVEALYIFHLYRNYIKTLIDISDS